MQLRWYKYETCGFKTIEDIECHICLSKFQNFPSQSSVYAPLGHPVYRSVVKCKLNFVKYYNAFAPPYQYLNFWKQIV